MKYLIPQLVLLGILSGSVGCALCSSPYDNDYVTYGGKVSRENMRCGRVGSPFSDHRVAGEPATDFEVLEESVDEPVYEEGETVDEGFLLVPDTASVDPNQYEESDVEEMEEAPSVKVASAVLNKPSSKASLSDSSVQPAAAVRPLPQPAKRSISGGDPLFD